MAESERRDFWEIAEDLATPVSRWHEQIGDPRLADAILDRLVHNAYRIEMRGESTGKGGFAASSVWGSPSGRTALQACPYLACWPEAQC